MKEMESKEHQTQEWRLFIDSDKDSLKAVLLHNGNKTICPSGLFSPTAGESDVDGIDCEQNKIRELWLEGSRRSKSSQVFTRPTIGPYQLSVLFM